MGTPTKFYFEKGDVETRATLPEFCIRVLIAVFIDHSASNLIPTMLYGHRDLTMWPDFFVKKMGSCFMLTLIFFSVYLDDAL
jgi:hypothetical protein